MAPPRRSRIVAATFGALLLFACGGGGGTAGGGTSGGGTTYTISGAVLGDPAGVTISLTGPIARTTVPDAGGKFSFGGLASGSYTVTPSKAGFTFNPASLAVMVNGADAGGNNFTATPTTHAIVGTVSGNGQSFLVVLSGDASDSALADPAGNYRFEGLRDGHYTLTPANGGYTFSPSSMNVIVSGADVRQDFVATLQDYTLAGTVSGDLADGVTVQLSGDVSAPVGSGGLYATTAGGGAYSFPGLWNGSYTLTPWKQGYTFTPSSIPVRISGGSVLGQNFTATRITYSIGGAVSGAIADGVLMTLTGHSTATTTTAGGGGYSFSGLANGDYSITPSKSGYVFTPASIGVTVSDGSVNARDFSAARVYSISGVVSGPFRSGAALALAGTGISTTTDANGRYVLSGLGNGSYTVVPTKAVCDFAPVAQAVTVSGADLTGKDFNCSGSWSSEPSGTSSDLYGVWGSSSSDVWAVGGNGTILHWTGGAWTNVASGTANRLRGVWGTGPGDAWAVGDSGTILHWNGSAWAGVNGGTARNLQRVSGTSANDVWVIGDYGTTLHWDGATWSTVPTSAFATIWASGSRDVWGAGPTSVEHWDGSSWTTTLSGAVLPQIYGMWGSGSQDVWAVGDWGTSGATQHWTGAAWSTVSSGTPNLLQSVWGSGANDAWAVGRSGTTLHWDGSLWSAVSSGTTSMLFGVWEAASSDAWMIVGAAGTILRPSQTPPGYAISGSIGGAKVAGVEVAVSGTRWGSTNTDASGAFSIGGLPVGAYTVTPFAAGYNFTPASRTVTVTSSSVSAGSFTANVAGPGTLTIVNATPMWNVGWLFASAGGGSNWGPNRLLGPIVPGASFRLTNIPPGIWSFQAVTQYGTSHWTLMNVYIDNASPLSWTLTEANIDP